MSVFRSPKRVFTKFFKHDEDGSATIESVLWMPVFLAFFCLIVDISMVFNAQANLTRILQDANRSYSLGRLDSAAATQTYIRGRLGREATDADTQVVTVFDSSTGIITSAIKVEAGYYMATGLFASITGMELKVVSQHMMES